jgi:hypothetical protein
LPAIDDCLARIMAIRGALGASLIDYSTGLVIGAAGHGPNSTHEVTAAGVADLVQGVMVGAPFAPSGKPDSVREILVSAGNGYHLVQFVEARFDTRVVLYLWLDGTGGNLALTQHRLRSIARELVLT